MGQMDRQVGCYVNIASWHTEGPHNLSSLPIVHNITKHRFMAHTAQFTAELIIKLTLLLATLLAVSNLYKKMDQSNNTFYFLMTHD